MIYLVNSVIHLLNNWGLKVMYTLHNWLRVPHHYFVIFSCPQGPRKKGNQPCSIPVITDFTLIIPYITKTLSDKKFVYCKSCSFTNKSFQDKIGQKYDSLVHCIAGNCTCCLDLLPATRSTLYSSKSDHNLLE